ncbi:tetraspanin-8-like [Hippoglossus stenolepis]|uniref:tetraspanin-8-like n=1 Tax=Hippoglossus stenolepis TaxID=195615 RepID=UPI001FB02C6C|nr:tetraspanin-8-like [Hippoglossus stenolepis]
MAVHKIIKYLLFTINFVFFVAGITILGLSVHARSNRADYQITDNLLPPINLLVFVGAVTMILGFLGCCGAVREDRRLLKLFFVGLFAVLFMMLALGVLGALSRTEAAQEVVKEHLKELLPLSAAPKDVQESFQQLERSGFCCGFFVGPLDWGNSTVVPDSCNCTDTSRNCTVLDGRQVYSTPCMTYFMTWLDRLSHTFIMVACGFGILMILGMVFSSVIGFQVCVKKGSVI